jgi:hypothetical protein
MLLSNCYVVHSPIRRKIVPRKRAGNLLEKSVNFKMASKAHFWIANEAQSLFSNSIFKNLKKKMDLKQIIEKKN